jgi:DEAD/DEAH box helicase domain-containing protein
VAQRCAKSLRVGEDQTVHPDPEQLLARLTRLAPERLVHVQALPARVGTSVGWPDWIDEQVRDALGRRGIANPWAHQADAAELAWSGQDVVVATGTASGKSLAFLMPALTDVLEGTRAPNGRGATVLYLSPTKALANDQLRALQELELGELRCATYDGDTPHEERAWIRAHASYVLTNPDLLHRSLLPGHARWASFLRALKYVVVDECHVYRGVFGSHVAQVLRRLARVAALYGSNPTFIAASATSGAPAESASRLIGREVVAVADDSSPRGSMTFALWEPALREHGGENDAPTRRSATAETASLLTDLVVEGVRTLAFVRSRRGVEAVAMTARDTLAEVDPDLMDRVAAYRAGYLPEERRALEASLRSGELLGVAATNALELGIDVTGLDSVLMCGWPGTRASLWQQAGRAGRSGRDALSILIARDDPLDTYLVHHPGAIFGQPVEATVFDPSNIYVLAPHLAAAAAESPLTETDLPTFGPTARTALDQLVERGLLRARPSGWFWTRAERASDLTDLRGIGGSIIKVVEDGTGRLLGTVDPGAAHSTVHQGAVYVHQGSTYLVDHLSMEDHVALVHRENVDYTTTAREISDITIADIASHQSWGEADLYFGQVDVSSKVVAFLKRRYLTGEVLGEEPLSLPTRNLHTSAVWWTIEPDRLKELGLAEADLPGCVHAAEHASIGLLPLVATCDRWDIGGVSTARHEQTERLTSFVYDGHPGGAGFAERGFQTAQTWLSATRDAIASCECTSGCPSCIQSPKCGNGNDPLDKGGALTLLTALLERPFQVQD